MGAYAFLSSYAGFQGVSFLFIRDLSQPDQLLNLGNLSINMLPFVMTFINLYSGYTYSKGEGMTEKLTIVLMALFFLVILYSSPSSLLVYWTFNNVFSLVKSLVYDKKEVKEAL